MGFFILASASEGRAQLLKKLGYSFRVLVSNVKEHHLDSPEETVLVNAVHKALAVAKRTDAPVVAADTCVYYSNRIIGKPKSKAAAAKMLKALCGKWHRVYTATVISKNKQLNCSLKSSAVKLLKLSEAELRSYVASGLPLKRAGGYAIQDPGIKMVEKIDGDVDTVIGIDTKLLRQFC
ncbi:MAG: Maf family nucleotide pyrophosphatase [Candidatus Micrarchaeota archaeon]